MCSKVNFVAREYNPHTEELAAEAASDMTVQNLKMAIANPNQQLDASKIIHYSNFTTATARTAAARSTAINSNSNSNQHHQQQQQQQQQHVDAQNIWTLHLTQFISRKVLDRHSLTGTGDKIIPGAYSMGDEHQCRTDQVNKDNKDTKDKDCQHQDGLSMNYKPIPTIPNDPDPALPILQRHTKIHSHSGTRRYLASLSPSQRTAFFIHQRDTDSNADADSNANADTPRLPADALFGTILNDYYDNQWELLLGEMQLSFCVFICCSCLTSLEHWRDVIYIMSLVSGDTIMKSSTYCQLYHAFMLTVRHQLQHFDCSIFRVSDIFSRRVNADE